MVGPMGGNVFGGYGRLHFPSAQALAAWRDGSVGAARWSDWQELGTPSATDAVVAERLGVSARGVLSVQIDGARLTLTYEDADFEAHAADLASALRASERHGAEGELFFLETGDAEHDGLVLRLTIGAGTSQLVRLTKTEARAAYGAGYRAFQARARALEAAAHPALAALDRWIAEGTPLDPGVAATHGRILEALADCPDRVLAQHARAYGGYVLSTSGQRERFLVKETRAALTAARSNDHRAAALFALSLHAPARCLPLAIEVLERSHEAPFPQPMREVAMGIAARAGRDDAPRVWPHLARPFEADWPSLFSAAVRGMTLLDADLSAPLGALLETLAAYASARPQPWDVEPGPAELFAGLIAERALPLWCELAAYVAEARADRGRYRVVDRIVASGDGAAIEQLRGASDDVLVTLTQRAKERLRPSTS